MELLKQTLNKIKPLDEAAMIQAQNRLDSLTKPRGSLGVLEDTAVRLAGITSIHSPRIDKKAIVIMAADHGVVAEGVAAFPQEVTVQMIHNFLNGGAAVNVLARHAGAEVFCVDVGVKSPIEADELIVSKVKPGTGNIARGPAMNRKEAVAALEVGIRMADNVRNKGITLVGTGEMGIGNTTAASALLSYYTGLPAEQVTGRGTGVDDAGLVKKIKAIKNALSVNILDKDDPIGVLAGIGGLEIAGIAGLVLGCAVHRIPVVTDGFISTAGVMMALKICPMASNFVFASHVSYEPGHKIMLQHIGLTPMLVMNMRLGEGTGAALAFPLMEAACKIINEMATFDEAGVSGRIG